MASNGSFRIWVGYQNRGPVNVWWRGWNYGTDVNSYPFYNPWPFDLNGSCMTQPEELVVSVCSLMECQGGSLQYRCSQEVRRWISPPGDQPRVNPRILAPEPAQGPPRFVIDHDVTGTSSTTSASAVLIPLAGGAGITLGTWSLTGSGTTAPITVPEPGNIHVTWNYCGVVRDQTIPVDWNCDDCESACPSCTRNPVRIANGNTRFSDVDPLPGTDLLSLKRTYDSSSTRVGYFGRRWSSLFDARARRMTIGSDTAALVDVIDESGNAYLFRRASPSTPYVQIGPAPLTSAHILQASGTGWIFSDPDRRLSRHFDANGRITKYSNALARELSITYSGTPACPTVIDSWGRPAWRPVCNASGRIERINFDGLTDFWTYEYAGDHLDRALSPAGVWRDYNGSGAGVDWRITAIVDPQGNTIETHTYDAAGRGTDSHGPDEEIDLIEYWLPGRVTGEYRTLIHYKSGRVETHYQRTIAGKMRTVEVSGGCASCGAGVATYVHDRYSGNVIRHQNADGYVTEHTYDAAGSRRLSTRGPLRPMGCDPAADANRCRKTPDELKTVALVTTAETVTASFAYGDANWPQQPTVVTVNSVYSTTSAKTRSTTSTFDPVTGDTLIETVQGWTGDPTSPVQHSQTTTVALYDGTEGAAFNPGGTAFLAAWATLPQPSRMRKSVDGPRSDVTDRTRYVYYPVDAAVPARLRGRLAAIENAAGHVTRFEDYDHWGTPTTVVDPNGVTTTTVTDGLGRRASVTLNAVSGCDTSYDPLCATNLTSTFTYHGAGAVATEQRPGGGVTSYAYDSRSRLHTVSRGPSATDLREQHETTYDPATGRKSLERLLAREGAAWVEKTRQSFTYDRDGQLASQVHADGSSIVYTYDADGRVESVRDEVHPTPNTRYRYDSAGRLKTVRQTLAGAPNNEIATSYGYDLHGNLRSVTDPNGNVTTYVYDDFGRMLRQESPVTGLTTYGHDAAGNLLTTTDANGAATNRSYDALGRVLSATSTRNGATESVTWSYDSGAFGAGRLAFMTDPTGSTRYRYDRRGLLVEETKTIGGDTYVTAFAYDRDGNRSRIVYPSGRVAGGTFDYAGRPVSLTSATAPIVTSAKYLPFGPMTELRLGNGTIRKIAHDARYRITANELIGPSGPIAAHDYGHDAAGNVTRIHDRLDPAYNRDFGYDELHRLTAANGGTALWGAGAFTYDPMGNMRSRTLGSSQAMFTYSGTSPKLTGVTENGLVRGVSYDAAGNELLLGAAASEYSPRNHLAAAAGATYAYDGRGVRTVTTRPARIGAVSLSPAVVAGGFPSSGTVTLTAPAAVDAVISLASSSSAARVPSAVTIPAGGTAATFTITTTPVAVRTAATITAAWSGSSQSAALTLTAPELDSLAVSPSRVAGGSPVSATLSLTGAAVEATTVVLASSTPWLVVPPSVTIAAGQSSAGFTATTAPVDATVMAAISARAGTVERAAQVRIDPAALSALDVSPASVIGGESATAAIALGSPAGPAGVSVPLAASNEAVLPTPPAVSIAPGATTGQTALPTRPVAAATPVIVSATHDGITRSSTVNVLPPPVTLASVSIAPTSLIGTNAALGTVVLTEAAPAGGLEIDLTSGDAAVAAVPASIVVAAGASQASFAVSTSIVSSAATVAITAMHGIVVKTATLTVLPPPGNHVSALSVTPAFIVGGTSASGQVTLAAASTENGGSDVALASSDPAIASVPSTVRVGKNKSTATFTLATTARTAPAPVVISAAYGGVIQRVTIIVAPENSVALAAFAIHPDRVIGGNASSGTVSLTAPAPHGGAVVTIENRRRNIVSVPSTVMIPAGATSAAFAIATDRVNGRNPRAADLTATYNGVSVTATVTVLPTQIAATATRPPVLCAATALAPCLAVPALTLAGESVSARASRYTLYSPELSLLAETSETAAATHPIAYEYLWFAGQPIAQIETATGEVSWYFSDHLGTPILQTDASAQVVWRAEYDPYGNVFAFRAGASKHQPLRFPGQENDGSAELSYNVFRWYRAGWGRYTQGDPIGLQGGPNLYGYVGGNPLANIDPLGLVQLRMRGSAYPVSLGQLDRICRDSQGNVTGGACTTSYVATATCPCSCSGNAWKMEITIHVSFTTFYYDGPWNQLTQTRRPHPSVINAETAVAHEVDYHLYPAARMLSQALEPYEQIRYGSERECIAACTDVRNQVVSEYASRVRTTQASEEAGGNPNRWW